MTRPPSPRPLVRIAAVVAGSLLLVIPLAGSRADAEPVTSPRVAPAAALPSTTTNALQADLVALTGQGAIGATGTVDAPAGSWSGAAGVRTIDGSASAVVGDSARIGSLTKPMVATLAMQEVQRGRWTLATTVGQVVPGLLPGHEGVTLEQLLSHRSGIPYIDQVPLSAAPTGEELRQSLSGSFTARGQVARALQKPWLFEPGTNWSYANAGYMVIGLMLEQVNQTPLAQLMATRIFTPAAMTSSRFTTDASWGRDHLGDYAVLERPYNLDATQDASAAFGAGAVESTPADLDRFWRSLLTGKLLSQSLVTEMTRVRTPGPNYALGVISFEDPCRGTGGKVQQLYGHDGATFGTQSLAFTSADGTRQASISWSGRNLRTDQLAQLGATFVYRAFVATCPSTTGMAVRQAKIQTQAKELVSDAPDLGGR